MDHAADFVSAAFFSSCFAKRISNCAANSIDSWGEQNIDALPQLINPTQPQAWLIRLFEFLPLMADMLGKSVQPWWAEILQHLPPITTGAPDAIGGGLYWGHATNALSPDDSLCLLLQPIRRSPQSVIAEDI